jgi:hypothetical protein
MVLRSCLRLAVLGIFAVQAGACGGDDDGNLTVADRYRVGAACRSDADCPQPDDGSFTQKCLTEFTGGYCGLENCRSNDDCPPGSACATLDGNTYCFRQCTEKYECNANRSPDVEANCSANVSFVDRNTPGKPCVPPSSGL